MMQNDYDKLNQFINENNISIYEMWKMGQVKSEQFLRKCYPPYVFALEFQYFKDFFTNRLFEFKRLEENVKNFKYCFIGQTGSGPEPQYFSNGWADLNSFNKWLEQYSNENMFPVCMIIDGEVSDMKFEKQIRFRLKK